MQLGLAVAELFQRAYRRDDVVPIRARMTVALTHVVQLLLEREPSGILHMPAIDHVAQRLHPAFGPALEPDRAHAFAVDGGDLLARAQVGDGAAAFLDRHAVGDAAA